MFWIIVALLGAPSSRAEPSPPVAPVRVPEAVKQKWREVRGTVVEASALAKSRLDQLGREDEGKKGKGAREPSRGLLPALKGAGLRVWGMARGKLRATLLYLDSQFHKRVLEPSARGK